MSLYFVGYLKGKSKQLSDTNSRIVFNIKPALAPIKMNILPLIKKKHAERARELYAMLVKYCMVQYEESGSNSDQWISCFFGRNLFDIICRGDSNPAQFCSQTVKGQQETGI